MWSLLPAQKVDAVFVCGSRAAKAVNARMCKENIFSNGPSLHLWITLALRVGQAQEWSHLNSSADSFQSWLTSGAASPPCCPDVWASWRLMASLLWVAILISSLTWCPLNVCWSSVSIPGRSLPFASDNTVPALWPLCSQANLYAQISVPISYHLATSPLTLVLDVEGRKVWFF